MNANVNPRVASIVDGSRASGRETRESDEQGGNARFVRGANEAVQLALDELARFGLHDTRPLERALLDATLFVAVWSIHRPGHALAKAVPIVVEDSCGETLLALFTDEARLARYAMNLLYRCRPISFRHVPQLVAALGYESAVLDPGHVHSRILPAQLLARAARGRFVTSE
jgi:hypothetical protein